MREEKEQLFDEKQQLQDVSDRYDRVVRVLGENAVDDAVQQDIQEQKALEEKRQMEQMPTGSIHERLAGEPERAVGRLLFGNLRIEFWDRI